MEDLPEQFSIQDPFAFGAENTFINFPVRAVQSNIYGNVSPEDVILKTIKIFAARELRPRLFNWFEDLSKETGENIEELAKIPLKIQQVLETILVSSNASKKLIERVKKAVPISLFGASEYDFLPQTVVFLANHFQAFRKTSLFEKTDLFQVVGKCEPEEMSTEGKNEAVYKCFVKMVEVMFDSWLGFGPLVSEAMSIAYTMISKGFQNQIYQWHGTFTVENLEEIDNTVRSWLSTFAPQTDETERILQRSHESICCLAIGMLMQNIYDMAILNYPDSSETIATLRYCFAHTHNYGREATLTVMLEKVRKQLLSVEEDTSVILDGFANCVHSLKELDPSCSFMHRVCTEIREFLKKRPDTVRKIINYITSEKREQLSEQLGTRSGTIIDEDEFRGTNDEFLAEGLDTAGWEDWMPDPPDAPSGKSSHVRQSADVFNMLISVYGSKEMFVKEYRKLLSERLTSFAEQDSIFEQRYLEILKQRFNEGELSQCEVMLRDVIESARVEKLMALKQLLPVTASVISSHFWPLPELDKSLVFPELLEEGLELYTKIYRENKSSRRLNWLKSWGWAEVELTLGSTTVTRFVSNQHAAVLYLFAEQESWSPPDVATRLGITKGVARRRLEWWGNQGLLIQELPTGATSEEWRLVEDGSSLENTIRHTGDASDDEDGAAIEDVSDAADALEAYWMYTRNYIAQNESVKAERIHKIFKMFASPSSQGPSLDVVNTFLFRKVKQNLLSFQSGGFRVVKDAPATS